jgi:hypothetical protein
VRDTACLFQRSPIHGGRPSKLRASVARQVVSVTREFIHLNLEEEHPQCGGESGAIPSWRISQSTNQAR